MGLRFFLPDGMRFSCERCGECCGGWSVPVDARDYKTLIEAGVCEGRKLFQRVVFKKKRFLRLVEDRCVLLAKDGLCSAYDHRPSICRLFPFRVRDTPSGLFVGLSYSCRSVAYGRGRPLSELSAMVSALSVNRGVEQPACESVSLDGV